MIASIIAYLQAIADHPLRGAGDGVAEPGPFEAFYASAWQHPLALWLAAARGRGDLPARGAIWHASVRRYGRRARSRSRCSMRGSPRPTSTGSARCRARSRARSRSSSCSRATRATCSSSRPPRPTARSRSRRARSRARSAHADRADRCVRVAALLGATPRVLFSSTSSRSARSRSRCCAGTRTRARCRGCAP